MELYPYSTLLTALGVPERFSPRDFVSVLKKLEVEARGRPLDTNGLGIAVGK